MREIKFRAWLTEQEIMIYSFNQASLDSMEFWQFTDNGIEIQVQEEVWRVEGGEPVDRMRYVKADAEIMQFTGLKDKNDKDIYEGDIVQWKTRRYKSVYTGLKEDRDKLQTITWRSAVEWDMNCFCITESFDPIQNNNSPLVDDETLEIIGNIHENHALLK